MLVGKQFGRYEIRQKLGAGGMGEVYLARDEQLDRQVALKILSAEFSSDPVRQNRFRQEAKAASALNHPNIITIHEIGESEHGAFLATEFIKGETLRETIKRSPLPLFRAVKIAEQVAAALGAAHEAHIVHRDIKPENIMIRGDGYVKVLDFGLAKLTVKGALENAESDLNSNNTLPGVVMGSVRYMSPEQARGQQIDERTDIWSLGAVFYEMLTGHAPFDGATPSDTLAAVIYKAPEPVSHFVPNAPAELQRIVRRALQKDRDERYQNIKDFALDLKNLLYEIEHEISLENKTQPLPAYLGNTVESERIHRTSGANQPTHITSVPTTSAEYIVEQVRRHKWQTAIFSFGLIAVLAAIGLGYFRWNGQKPVATVKAFEKTQISRLTTDGKVRLPAISSDGKYVAYLSGEMGSRSLVVRQVATDSLVTIVPPTAQEFRGINFSPDGNYIYYVQLTRDYSIGTLYQVPTLGGTPKKLIEDIDSGVTFAPDGKRLAFLRHNPTEASDEIFTANSDGSNLQRLISTRQTKFNFFLNPAWSPDGTKILVGAGKSMEDEIAGIQMAEISVTDGNINLFNDKRWKKVADFCWLTDGSGFLLTAQESDEGTTQIWRVSYPDGEFHPLTNDLNDYFKLGVSADSNTLISIKSDSVSTVWSFAPATRELTQIMSESRNMEGEGGLAEMPDGKLIFSRRDNKEVNLWQADKDGRNPQKLTNGSRYNSYPVVTPDGRFIIFSSNRSGSSRIWRMEPDGKNPVQLTQGDQMSGDFEPLLLPDGKNIIFHRHSKANDKSFLLKISIEGGEAAPIHAEDDFANFMPTLSPDGKHLAFVTFNTVNFKKFLRVMSFDGERVGEIEKDFEYNLIGKFAWSPDSKSITYLSVEGIPNLWKLPLDGGKPQPLTDFKSGRIFNFTWSRDGKKLFIVRGVVNNDLILIRDAARVGA